MKTLIITISVVCAVVAYYFGIRYLSGQDLGFTPAKYVGISLMLACFTKHLI
jgi:hypothetical protein